MDLLLATEATMPKRARQGLCEIFSSSAVTRTARPYKGIRVDFIAASQVRVTGVNFDNLYISNFGTAIYLRGLYNSNFNNCFIYNNYYGFYFYGQAITTSITNCNIQRGIIGGQGGAWGVSFQAIDGESTENTHISGGQVYGYDININVGLAFELQIEHCDISEAQSIGIQITSTNGGLWVRDCWMKPRNPRSPREFW